MPYLPPHDEVTDRAVLIDFIARHPLATLVTGGEQGPQADLIPLLLVESPDGPELIGHVARANPLWQPGNHEGTTLAVFGPVQHYISPTWYPSKGQHHRVVPTWNYLMVQARGRLQVHDDPSWTRAAVARLTHRMESGRAQPWRIGMAPPDYLDDQLARIVGIRMPVERLIGKFKVSAARTDLDRLGARDGVLADAGPEASEVAQAMSQPPQGTSWP